MAQLKDTTVTGSIAVSGTANITGATQHNGDVTLYAASGDSPSLIFQRGTTSDTLNDYKIVDTGGHLTIKQSGNSGTSGYTQVAKLTNTGILSVSTPPATDTTPSTTAWISPTDSEVKIATDATIATGDKLIVRDTSDSNKMRSSSISFDTTNTTDYLRKDGTWATPAGGGGDVFWVTLSLSNSVYSFDHTFGEIEDAVTNGKTVLLYDAVSQWSGAQVDDGAFIICPLTNYDPYEPAEDEYYFYFSTTYIYGDGVAFCYYMIDVNDNVVASQLDYLPSEIFFTRADPTTATEYFLAFRDSNSSTSSLLYADYPLYKGITYKSLKGTTSALGYGELILGNNKNSGVANNKYGCVSLYPKTGNYTGSIVTTDTLTGNRTLSLPDKSGTLATTDDITTAIGNAIAASY